LVAVPAAAHLPELGVVTAGIPPEMELVVELVAIAGMVELVGRVAI
jgi:hypothetical protein